MTQDEAATPAPPPISEAELERKHTRFFAWISLAENLGGKLIIGATVVAGIFCGLYLPVKISHGETTAISFFVTWFTDFKVNIALAWGAACGVGWLAYAERKKRLKERKERDERIEELEHKIDPNRTSSGLTVDGHQPREDS